MRVGSLLAVSGSRNWSACGFQLGVVERDGVAHCPLDGESEEVADAADVAAAGVDLLQDAVFAQRLGSEVRSSPSPRELAADRDEAWCAAPADEQMRVDAVRPGPCPVVEPGAEAN